MRLLHIDNCNVCVANGFHNDGFTGCAFEYNEFSSQMKLIILYCIYGIIICNI